MSPALMSQRNSAAFARNDKCSFPDSRNGDSDRTWGGVQLRGSRRLPDVFAQMAALDLVLAPAKVARISRGVVPYLALKCLLNCA